MVKIMFICHGNICRSPMAKFIFEDLALKQGVAEQFSVDSCATSREEIGKDMYPPAKRKLKEKAISFGLHAARQMTQKDYEENDVILLMDRNNAYNIQRIVADPYHKIHRLLPGRDVADPWYTDDFERAYQDIQEGCEYWLQRLLND